MQWHVVYWKSTNSLEEHATSIFRVEEYAKQETSIKQAKNSALYRVTSQMVELFITATKTKSYIYYINRTVEIRK